MLYNFYLHAYLIAEDSSHLKTFHKLPIIVDYIAFMRKYCSFIAAYTRGLENGSVNFPHGHKEMKICCACFSSKGWLDSLVSSTDNPIQVFMKNTALIT